MKVTLLLADHAEVAEGKLFINGGGWTVTGPDPIPFGIAMYIEVPGTGQTRSTRFSSNSWTRDGQPVTVETDDGVQPITGSGEFEVTRPLGIKAGTPLPIPMALNFAPLPIPPGGRFEWRLSINGETEEDWRLSFSTRPRGPESMAA